MRKMERLNKIIDVLRREGSVSVKYLAEMLEVSEPTVRRDIKEIMRILDLPVKKVHGGVILEIDKGSIEPMFETKMSLMADEKRRIARKALEFIEDGDSIILDSGTTAYYLAKLLHKRKGLKVITVDVKIAEELARFSEITAYIVAGNIRPGYYSVGGTLTEQILSQFHVEKAFLTADAIHPEIGVTNSSMFEVGVKKKIVDSGKQVILIADHSKIGKKAFIKVCDLNKIDVFITSKGCEPELIKGIMEKIEVVLEV
ncbi:MAG: DeoR/GlpR transcriptional regulator [Thermotogae bacterium]|nr:DeoR/GlpR transcriptional regulator [Thermotogota bacterium]